MKIPVKLHFWLTGTFAVLLLPVCYATRVRLEFSSDLVFALIAWVLQSIVWAGLLYLFGVAGSWKALGGSWKALGENWKRFIVAAMIFLLLISVLRLDIRLLLICFCLMVVAEFNYHYGSWFSAASALAPWLYLTLGVQTALAYDTAIVSVRRFNLYDPFFQRLDAMIFGISVASISHSASSFYVPAEIIYYTMYGVMGAALLFLCLAGDQPAAFQMAGAISTAYFLSLIVFWIWPSNGPYSLDPAKFSSNIVTDAIQHSSYVNAAALYHHHEWLTPVYGYFVAFPSMHVAQPLLAGWFLRRWRRVSLLIFVYCGVLVPAIIVLEWHYLVDIVGGIMIAVLAVALASISLDRLPSWRPKSRRMA